MMSMKKESSLNQKENINNMINLFIDEYDVNKIDIQDIEKFTEDILEFGLNYLKFPYDTDIDVSIVDGLRIKDINNTTRDNDNITDVLSFPLNEFANYELIEESCCVDFESGRVQLGDIIINYDKVIEQAFSYGHSTRREYGFLLIHSLLHLLGYDHMNEDDEKLMFKKQEEVLERYGLCR